MTHETDKSGVDDELRDEKGGLLFNVTLCCNWELLNQFHVFPIFK